MKQRLASLTLLLAATVAQAQSVEWKPIGQQGDYRAEWASNLVMRDRGEVTTMMRLVYQREDAAPNNARFDNERIGVSIRCAARMYFILGKSYHFGEREVHSVSLATVGSYEPIAGTFIERFADAACAQ
jgi:hypothetical protein